MHKKYITLLLFVLFVTYSSDLLAQGRPCPNPGPGPCNPPGAPIDAGIGFLIVLGAGYAIKKIRDHKE